MIDDRDLEETALSWLQEDPDPETRAELNDLLEKGDDDALSDAFGSRLQFGTAGLRGVLGPGPNRMNRVMVRRATAGLAKYLLGAIEGAAVRGVVIGHDARKNSRVFAEDAARVLLGAGLKVYFYGDLVPTPLVSFATTRLGAASAIMITASHNPPEYNGYKVFWETGGQIVPPHDAGISGAIDEIGRSDLLPLGDLAEARAEGKLVDLGESMIERYLEGLEDLRVHPEAPAGSGLVLAYTPLHGVGAALTKRAFSRAGFDSVHFVREQREPDERFPTVRLPNPEEKGAMDAVIELGKETGADLALAADPDADRLGVALPGGAGGEWDLLGGDEIGAILGHYLLSEGGGGAERLVATSIVSTRMIESMAKHHGVHYVDMLTGLKWIVDAVLRHEAEHGSKVVIGYESALGYMVGDLVRDKDGVSAAAVFAEMAAWLKTKGRTVRDYLDEAYRLYGLYSTRTVSIVFPPAEMDRISALMENARRSPPEIIGDKKVRSILDLSRDETDLPPANLLIHQLDDGARVMLRPSGTEPKLKSYYEVRETVSGDEDMEAARARASSSLDTLARAHQALLEAL